jgi:platelet-activating factor acetylhydrolase
MPSLPEPIGPFPVSATTLVRRLPKAIPIGPSLVKRGGTKTEPTLLLSEVAFTVFAPAADIKHSHRHGSWFGRGHNGGKGVDWVVRPVHETVKGYSHFSGKFIITPFTLLTYLTYLFSLGRTYPPWLSALLQPLISTVGGSIKIAAYPNAPLRLPPDNTHRWPLAIFSHGLAGSRTTYSALCTRLASQGRVVLAMEHRDGTGPAVFPADRPPLYYINPDDVEWPGFPDPDPEMAKHTQGAYDSESALRLRNDQLDFRRREVYEAVRAFGALVGGAPEHGNLAVVDNHVIDWDSWKDRVEISRLDLIGHSFGGATVVCPLYLISLVLSGY